MEFSHEDSRKGKYENHIQYNTNPPQRKNSSGQSHISGMNPLPRYMKVGKIRLTSVVRQESIHDKDPAAFATFWRSYLEFRSKRIERDMDLCNNEPVGSMKRR